MLHCTMTMLMLSISLSLVPPDLCLLGCVFLMLEYQDPEADTAEHASQWERMIREYGGEVVAKPSTQTQGGKAEDGARQPELDDEQLWPRLTHILCRTQDSIHAQRGLREGKRLVTAPWLSDVITRKKVLPPWKAIHFPLPPK